MRNTPSLNHDVIEQFQHCLNSVRAGSDADLGALLDFFRKYLLMFAARKLSRNLALKSAPSDLVQETLMTAAKRFSSFRGDTERDLRIWLTKIMKRKVIDTHRFYRGSEARDISREVPFLACDLPAGRISDSGPAAVTAEKSRVLSQMLSQLDRAQQEVIRLRSFERCSFEEVGKQIGRSAEAARKLWERAILRLAQEFRVHESRSKTAR